MDQTRIFVVGHRNPDTDSICSALAYARLRQLQGVENIIAARAGNVNRQTEFVLEELGVPQPQLLIDVHPRVRDVVGKEVMTIDGGAPLSRALELFHLHNFRLLPVVDEERRPRGLLVLKRVAERFLVPREEAAIRRVQASPASLRRCLKATALTEFDAETVEELSLYVGAMASATFDAKFSLLDARRLVLITGDRENIQRKGIEMGVRVLIVTGSLPVSETLLEAARKQGVTVLSTPFDTATSAWLTRLSTPVARLVGADFISVGLNDRLDELRLKLTHGKDPGAVVLDGEGRVAAVATKSNLLKLSAAADPGRPQRALPGGVRGGQGRNQRGGRPSPAGEFPYRGADPLHQPAAGQHLLGGGHPLPPGRTGAGAADRRSASGRASLRHGDSQVADHHRHRPGPGRAGSAPWPGATPRSSAAGFSPPAAPWPPTRAFASCCWPTSRNTPPATRPSASARWRWSVFTNSRG